MKTKISPLLEISIVKVTFWVQEEKWIDMIVDFKNKRNSVLRKKMSLVLGMKKLDLKTIWLSFSKVKFLPENNKFSSFYKNKLVI